MDERVFYYMLNALFILDSIPETAKIKETSLVNI